MRHGREAGTGRSGVRAAAGPSGRLVRAVLSAVALVVASAPPALATWSVIAIDRGTGEVVIASATCVPQARFAGFPARDLMDVQAIVVPGRAVAAAQAGVDRSRRNQTLIYDELTKGSSPTEILERLAEDPEFERRQFAIVDRDGRGAGHSGRENRAVAQHVVRHLTVVPISFAVQGNILASDAVVRDAVAAFEEATGSLADRVMAAMEAADRSGGDRRCTCDTEPRPQAPCETKTAHVAYILRADATDAPGSSFNDGHYSMYLSVTDEDITPGEDANPVKTLRMRYDAWRADHAR